MKLRIKPRIIEAEYCQWDGSHESMCVLDRWIEQNNNCLVTDEFGYIDVEIYDVASFRLYPCSVLFREGLTYTVYKSLDEFFMYYDKVDEDNIK